jgi:hypothetical protein
MAERFPNVSFDWLGELPGIAEAARTRGARRETLASLRGGSADDLIAAGSRLMAAGDLEGGLKLVAEGRQRKAIDLRASYETEYLKQLPGIQGLFGAKPPAAAPPAGEGTVYTPPAAAPDIWSGPQGTLPGRQSAVEPTQQSPTEAVLAAAQGQRRPVGPQLAGPLPTAEPPAPPGLAPSTVQGAQVPAPPPLPAAPRGPRPVLPGLDPADQEKMDQIGQALIRMGTSRTTSPGQLTALKQEWNRLWDKAKVDPEVRRWQASQSDRWERGLPGLSYDDWKIEPTMIKQRTEDASNLYQKEYRVKEQRGKDLSENLAGMKTLMADPSFVSGETLPATMLDKVQRRLSSLVDIARALGIPTLSNEAQAKLTKPAALREAYTSLANRTVVDYIGRSLGVGVSNTDREYIGNVVPSLLKTRQGNELIIKFLELAADRGKKEGQVARNYLDRAKNQATVWGMDAEVERVVGSHAATNSLLIDANGRKTGLARQMDLEVERANRERPPPEPPLTVGPAP